MSDERKPAAIDVFEHGIEVTVRTLSPAGLTCLATRENDMVYSGYTVAILDGDGTSLNHRVAYLVSTPGPYQTSDLWDENDVRYCLRSALYHLNRIIDMYARLCRLFDDLNSDSIRGNTSDDRIYFEVDSFFGDARRVYESMRKVLWRHYPTPGKSRWRGIRETMDDQSKIFPTDFATQLEQSWSRFGEKLTAYRDCISHYLPLTDNATCWMSRFDGRWGATVPLPTNPETKSRAAFDNLNEGTGIDAMGYCYEVAVHLVGLCEDLMGLPAVEGHIVNPSPQNYPLRQKSDVDPNPRAARINR
ncbi:hypothetical protein [Mycobacterium sp.]|jgi:hypothetical protein|uniref:hypothetical protein n=1 Tax=Mycobacterium sp. TaxID=1785 RepID=UPI003340DB9A|nr:hypothetical protein [Mycobacterium sp.]